jgi:hypothetical protein
MKTTNLKKLQNEKQHVCVLCIQFYGSPWNSGGFRYLSADRWFLSCLLSPLENEKRRVNPINIQYILLTTTKGRK